MEPGEGARRHEVGTIRGGIRSHDAQITAEYIIRCKSPENTRRLIFHEPK